jgi:hypothetical protein
MEFVLFGSDGMGMGWRILILLRTAITITVLLLLLQKKNSTDYRYRDCSDVFLIEGEEEERCGLLGECDCV